MTTGWNTASKTASAERAIQLLASRHKVALRPDMVHALSRDVSAAAYRFHLTHGLKREIPGGSERSNPVRVSPKAVAGLIKKLRNDLDRARKRAWEIQHLAPPVLHVSGEPVTYGTKVQMAGAAIAAEFLTRPDVAELHSLGLMEAIETMIRACDDQVAKVAGANITELSGAHVTERHRFCWSLADIYRKVTGRAAKPSDGVKETASGVDPYLEFFSLAWRISGAQGVPRAHAINTMLNEREKNRS